MEAGVRLQGGNFSVAAFFTTKIISLMLLIVKIFFIKKPRVN